MSDNSSALIGAGAGVIGTAFDAIAQIGQNKKAREHQEYMFDKANAYNTPAMQMQRFKAAGLNPHLIYGQGNSGNSSGVPPLTTQEAPKSNFADIAQNYVANKTQQAQQDQLKKALEVADAEIKLKNAQSLNAISGSAMTDQQRQQQAELFETVLAQNKMNLATSTQSLETGVIAQEKMRSEIEQLTANTKLTYAQKEKLGQDMLESKARIDNLRSQNKTMEIERELKQVELNWMRNGFTKTDPIYIRAMQQLFPEGTTGLKTKMINNHHKNVEMIKSWFKR